MKIFYIVIILVHLLQFPLYASQLIAESGEKQVALIELYTSEGCSSCPPADRWINELSKDKNLYKTFVPVVFHVDYWDYLGWKDVFSQPVFTERQRQYAFEWRAQSIYTPGFVLNGNEWRNWRRYNSPPKTKTPLVGNLAIIKNDNQSFIVRFSPIKSEEENYDVYSVLMVSDSVTDIKRGENRGRKIEHDFSVIDYKISRFVKKENNTYEAVFKFDLNQKSSMSIAAWVTKENSIYPIQTVGGEI